MRLLASILVMGALATVGAARQDSGAAAPTGREAWFEATEPLRIVGPIHYVGTRELGAYLITTPAGHILLDGAMPGSAPLVEASIRKLGYRPEDIRILLISQAHADHVGTLAALKKSTGASVAVMAADAPLVESGGTSDYLFATEASFHFEPVTVDRVLKDFDTVALGGVELVARLTPGHTPGTTTWITTVEDGGQSYRVVFPGSTSVNPGTRLLRNPSYPGIADDYRHAFRVLESLQPDVFLAAHAGAFGLAGKRTRSATDGVRAFVDPEGYRRRVAASQATFEAKMAEEKPPEEASAGLGGTSWRLVKFQGMDDTTLTPAAGAEYTIQFDADGGLVARIDCNRGRGTWKSSGPAQLELSALALTRAMCPPNSMHDQIVRQWTYVRSYVVEDGRLFLALMADGGIYEFEPISAAGPGS